MPEAQSHLRLPPLRRGLVTAPTCASMPMCPFTLFKHRARFRTTSSHTPTRSCSQDGHRCCHVSRSSFTCPRGSFPPGWLTPPRGGRPLVEGRLEREAFGGPVDAPSCSPEVLLTSERNSSNSTKVCSCSACIQRGELIVFVFDWRRPLQSPWTVTVDL